MFSVDIIMAHKKGFSLRTKLKIDHPLFKKLKNEPPRWWQNLKSDPELYIDIRKNNSLNVYYNGGSLMTLSGAGKYIARINIEYIPLEKENNYLPFNFEDKNITLNTVKTIAINNFSAATRERIKARIRMSNSNHSEKGIQGQYVIRANNRMKNVTGFFIDTEFQHDAKRIDLVWVDIKTKTIAFVELKTIGDDRLYIDRKQAAETIDEQLKKYYEFVRENKEELLKYYNKVFAIKKDLGILPAFVEESSLAGYELIEKPILLVGDCTQKWIDNNVKDLNNQLKEIAFGSAYQGKSTFGFHIPFKTSRYFYRLDQAY